MSFVSGIEKQANLIYILIFSLLKFHLKQCVNVDVEELKVSLYLFVPISFNIIFLDQQSWYFSSWEK